MYKKLRLLTTMLLLAVCCGTWAEEVAFTFATSKSSSNTAYATNYDITVNGMAWSCPGNQNFSGYVRIGGKSISTDVDRDIYSKVAMSDAISKITFNHNGISNKNLKVNKITLTVASDASFNNVVDTKVITPTFSVGTEGSFDFTPTSNNWAANSFYKFTINVTNTSSTNYGLDVKSIVFYKENGGSSLTQSDLALTNAPVALNFDLYNNSSAQTISYTTSSTGAVTVSGGDGYVTTSVNATNKTITVTPTSVTPSAQTITVSQAADDYYNAGTATFTVSVTNSDPNVPGTQDNPYTVAQARAAIDAGVGVTGVYVTGIVCEGGSSLNSGAMNYWISDDGTETDKFEIYKGKGIDGANFTSTDDVQVGDVVVIYGNLKKYNSTYEFDANSQLVSLQRPEITTPSISLSETTIEATADETEGTINVTYTNFSDVIADVEFYEADGETTATYDWVTAQIDDNNNLYYLIEANEGAARTAYLKVYALDDDDNEVYSELITISQAAYVEAINYTLASSITSGKHYIIVGSSTMADYAMGVQNNNNRAAVEIEISGETVTVASEDVHEVQICGPDANGFYTINDGGYLYAASSGSNYLRTEETLDDNGRWSITFGDEGVANIVAQGTNTRNTMQFNASNHIFACYASASQGDVYLYEKANEATPTQAVSISSVGLATFCSENALDFTGVTDVWAYIAKNENDNVTYKRVKRVPARTGVLLRNKLDEGAAISCNVPTLEGTIKDDVTDNMFIGTLTDINALPSVDGQNTNYILNNGENGVGFYKANDKKVGAGKAYLQLPTNAAKTFIGFEEEGEATSISTIDNGQLTMDNVYNLQGQKVGSEYKGIVIVNGKKFINK